MCLWCHGQLFRWDMLQRRPSQLLDPWTILDCRFYPIIKHGQIWLMKFKIARYLARVDEIWRRLRSPKSSLMTLMPKFLEKEDLWKLDVALRTKLKAGEYCGCDVVTYSWEKMDVVSQDVLQFFILGKTNSEGFQRTSSEGLQRTTSEDTEELFVNHCVVLATVFFFVGVVSEWVTKDLKKECQVGAKKGLTLHHGCITPNVLPGPGGWW